MAIRNTARTPTFSGVETTPWSDVDKSLGAFIGGYNKATGNSIDIKTNASDLPTAVRDWVAARTLLGDNDADNSADLIFCPVVNPVTNKLNKEALNVALTGRSALSDIQVFKESHFGKDEPQDRRRMVINSTFSQKWRRETKNSRTHIVVGMLPIRGNSVMNRRFYPDAEVESSYQQLNNLPTPAGHPKVEGRRVSAFHPMAINAQGIGGFIQNASKCALDVTCELWLDEQTANNTDKGKRVISRIMERGSLGASTGLEYRSVAENGEIAGQAYNEICKDILFDHVAILLDEDPAGRGNRVITNSDEDGGDIEVCFIENEVTTSDLHNKLDALLDDRFPGKHAWIRDVGLESLTVIARVNDMDIVGASKLFRIPFTKQGEEFTLSAEQEEVTEVTTFVKVDPNVNPSPATNTNLEDDMEITLESAKEFLNKNGHVALNAEQSIGLKAYQENQTAFEAYQKEQAEALSEKRKTLIGNSDLSEEDVADMSVTVLDKLLAASKSTTNPADNAALKLGGAGGSGTGEGGEVTADSLRETQTAINAKEE